MKICFIGTGYVGLVSGVLFSDFGNTVVCVDKDQKKINNFLTYSYWFDEWATVLAIAKKRNVIDFFVCRSHRFDLYNNISSEKYFRLFQMEYVDKVYTVSQDGCNHLKENFPSFSFKIPNPISIFIILKSTFFEFDSSTATLQIFPVHELCFLGTCSSKYDLGNKS